MKRPHSVLRTSLSQASAATHREGAMRQVVPCIMSAYQERYPLQGTCHPQAVSLGIAADQAAVRFTPHSTLPARLNW